MEWGNAHARRKWKWMNNKLFDVNSSADWKSVFFVCYEIQRKFTTRERENGLKITAHIRASKSCCRSEYYAETSHPVIVAQTHAMFSSRIKPTINRTRGRRCLSHLIFRRHEPRTCLNVYFDFDKESKAQRIVIVGCRHSHAHRQRFTRQKAHRKTSFRLIMAKCCLLRRSIRMFCTHTPVMATRLAAENFTQTKINGRGKVWANESMNCVRASTTFTSDSEVNVE